MKLLLFIIIILLRLLLNKRQIRKILYQPTNLPTNNKSKSFKFTQLHNSLRPEYYYSFNQLTIINILSHFLKFHYIR